MRILTLCLSLRLFPSGTAFSKAQQLAKRERRLSQGAACLESIPHWQRFELRTSFVVEFVKAFSKVVEKFLLLGVFCSMFLRLFSFRLMQAFLATVRTFSLCCATDVWVSIQAQPVRFTWGWLCSRPWLEEKNTRSRPFGRNDSGVPNSWF